jgi:energy-coupling factor transporter ATP-binding protein EcfA2
MRLKSLNYSQFAGQPTEWYLSGLELEDINLLVGKNASGKSRTVNIINGLANLLSRNTKLIFASGSYDAVFEMDGKNLRYILEYQDYKVISEKFILGDRELLDRGKGGFGKIQAQKADLWMDFQAPENELAAVVRQDSVQHPFFADLLNWAGSVYYYPFGTPLGRDSFLVESKQQIKSSFDARNHERVVEIFRQGFKEYGESFRLPIMSEMNSLDYALEDISVQEIPNIELRGGPPIGPLLGLCVKEKSLRGPTYQHDMSQGMFRALSVLIQITYAEMSKMPNAVLIDDIGEGLDFDRSCKLINILMEKAKKSHVQLVMATNDRFVMNAVPLQFWSVLRRRGNDTEVLNYSNSKERFDEFKFTGMNNFDFFATDFLSERNE